jgi:hypothetical protein
MENQINGPQDPDDDLDNSFEENEDLNTNNLIDPDALQDDDDEEEIEPENPDRDNDGATSPGMGEDERAEDERGDDDDITNLDIDESTGYPPL